MSEEEKRRSASESQAGKESPDLVAELREMGQQFEAMFRAAIESERTKQLQRDLAGGVREITNQVQTALKSLQSNPRVQQAEERGRQVFTQAQQSQFVQDVQETVTSGIAQINERLRDLVERLEQERARPGGSGSTSQRVPVESEPPPAAAPEDTPPTTGETTRLD